MTEETKTKTLNIFAILGFALLILVAIWSTFQVIKFVPRMFGGEPISFSLFSSDSSTPEIVLDSTTVESGKPFDIKWNFKSDKKGVLSFSYGCKPGFHFRIPGNSATEYTVLPCNAPYKLNRSDKSLTVIPITDKEKFTDIAFAITFTDEQNKSKRDVTTITVENNGSEVATSKDASNNDIKENKSENKDLFKSNDSEKDVENSTNNNSNFTGSTKGFNHKKTTKTVTKKVVRYVQIPVAPTSNPNGTANLSLKILSVGAIDSYTGAFIPKGTIKTTERAAVRFEVTNTGDKATGTWTYYAKLPTMNGYVYNSRLQPSLMPGAKATVTVTFDKLIPGRVGVQIMADPQNQIPETTKFDNTDARYFSVIN